MFVHLSLLLLNDVRTSPCPSLLSHSTETRMRRRLPENKAHVSSSTENFSDSPAWCYDGDPTLDTMSACRSLQCPLPKFTSREGKKPAGVNCLRGKRISDQLSLNIIDNRLLQLMSHLSVIYRRQWSELITAPGPDTRRPPRLSQHVSTGLSWQLPLRPADNFWTQSMLP